MASFFAELELRVAEIDSLLVVGLDPHVAELPEPTAAAAVAFCKRLIEATLPHAAAYKPNAAFFEYFGAEGHRALVDVRTCHAFIFAILTVVFFIVPLFVPR